MSILIILFWLVLTAIWAFRIEDKKLQLNHPGLILLGGIVSGAALYITTPALIPITILTYLAGSVAVSGFASSFIHNVDEMKIIGGAAMTIALFVIPMFIPAAQVIGAQALAEIPQVETADNVTDLIDTQHIRLTSSKTALWRADKVIGNLGYKVGVFEPDVQFIDGELQWLAPLDYTSLDKSLIYAYEGTEGYVIVSAEDPRAEPRRITGIAMVYTPNAILENDLTRHIWEDYPAYIIHNPVFQLNTENSPRWVTLLTQPALYGIIGEVPQGIVITDPVTGTNEFYNIGEQPSWIQRVWDEDLTEIYLDWWGRFSDGWINSWWGQRNLKYPTGEVYIDHGTAGATLTTGDPDVYMVEGTDGNQYWFSAITTPGKDASMIGYVLCDAQNGDFTFYQAPGYYNDLGAAANVQQNQKVAMASGLEIVQPIMYILDGEEVWIIPVISQTGEVMEIGLVVAHGGETFVADSLDEVITLWRGEVISDTGTAAPGDGITVEEIEEIRKLLDQLEAKLKAEKTE
ncbi:hypothetical protein [Methanogenium sp. MK-MG]|uniref:hypothetical protein n=1 Tax=Methanogenium sp. MK-MG TaxID=2599926 RepID=UPI0013ED82C6|nr:hypothetical protein [Methanogenium sp. MK-MG]KAF1076394.1 hypothetical protein MKMG_01530 [Methanogenium sp. MK-MG]